MWFEQQDASGFLNSRKNVHPRPRVQQVWLKMVTMSPIEVLLAEVSHISITQQSDEGCGNQRCSADAGSYVSHILILLMRDKAIWRSLSRETRPFLKLFLGIEAKTTFENCQHERPSRSWKAGDVI